MSDPVPAPEPAPVTLSLAEAAVALGVHYQTASRMFSVRTGPYRAECIYASGQSPTKVRVRVPASLIARLIAARGLAPAPE